MVMFLQAPSAPSAPHLPAEFTKGGHVQYPTIGAPQVRSMDPLLSRNVLSWVQSWAGVFGASKCTGALYLRKGLCTAYPCSSAACSHDAGCGRHPTSFTQAACQPLLHVPCSRGWHSVWGTWSVAGHNQRHGSALQQGLPTELGVELTHPGPTSQPSGALSQQPICALAAPEPQP